MNNLIFILLSIYQNTINVKHKYVYLYKMYYIFSFKKKIKNEKKIKYNKWKKTEN